MKYFLGIVIIGLCSLASLRTVAQSSQDIDVNFLFNYYDQDGDHAAVTGGIGTQELTDRALELSVNIPLDSTSALFFYAHSNVYTSASTDNIDNRVSSASKEDMRSSFEIGYSKSPNNTQQTYSVSAGGSTESDYLSAFIKGSWSIAAINGNQELNLATSLYFDTWLPIFPYEIRGTERAVITTNKRNSYALNAAFSQVINKRLQATFLADVVYQKGLLSTPFHRVYFLDDDVPFIEKLPDNRLKFPFGARLNYFINDFLINRYYYRFYVDNFGMTAHTFEIEAPFKVGQFFSIAPFYRWHTQTKADYFLTYQQVGEGATYYTSDYDLASLNSHKFGLALYYSPLYGLARFKVSKNRLSRLSNVAIRVAKYDRSDGFEAFLISLNCGFRLEAHHH